MTKHDDTLSQSSETTGFRSVPSSAVVKAIGSHAGATGSAVTHHGSSALGKLTPTETDNRVADALRAISGRRPAFKLRSMFPESGPAYSITEAVSWTCDEAGRRQALDAVEFSLRPAPEAMIAKALYELRTLTRGRVNRGPDEDEAEAVVWIERLRQYPADIVLDALLKWPSRADGQWWPTSHDVHKIIDAATIARRMLADHIRTGACLPKPATDMDRDDSPEGIAHRKAVVERNRAKLARPEDAPVSHIEDFDAWEARTISDLASERASGRLKLSSEALRALSPMMTDAEYRDWQEKTEARPTPEAKDIAA